MRTRATADMWGKAGRVSRAGQCGRGGREVDHRATHRVGLARQGLLQDAGELGVTVGHVAGLGIRQRHDNVTQRGQRRVDTAGLLQPAFPAGARGEVCSNQSSRGSTQGHAQERKDHATTANPGTPREPRTGHGAQKTTVMTGAVRRAERKRRGRGTCPRPDARARCPPSPP
jgi:hypothetical protein